MSALAQALVSLGRSVSGADRVVSSSDRTLWPPSIRRLESMGVKVFPDDGSGVEASIQRVIVSTAI